MRIKHLKNQLRTFTLNSGRSFYMYPLAELEISEQDYYLTPKLQSYIKKENAAMLIEDQAVEQVISPMFYEQNRKSRKQKKSVKNTEE